MSPSTRPEGPSPSTMLVVEPVRVQAAIWHCINNYGQFLLTVLVSDTRPHADRDPQITMTPPSWQRDCWMRATARWGHHSTSLVTLTQPTLSLILT